jgi:osmotically-inducible protein OsmY
MKPTTQLTHRPDAEVFVAARRALDENPAVPATVRLHVVAGVVTLTGTARVPNERAEAEDTVRRVDGVHHVVNDIFVLDVPSAGFEAPE